MEYVQIVSKMAAYVDSTNHIVAIASLSFSCDTWPLNIRGMKAGFSVVINDGMYRRYLG